MASDQTGTVHANPHIGPSLDTAHMAATGEVREDYDAVIRERDALRSAASLVVDYYDNLHKYGVDQTPDLGVRIARLNDALRAR